MDQYGNLPPTPTSAHSYSQTTPFPHPDIQHLAYRTAPIVPSPSQNTFSTNPIPIRLPPPSSMLPKVHPSSCNDLLSSEGHEHRQYNGEQQCIVNNRGLNGTRLQPAES